MFPSSPVDPIAAIHISLMEQMSVLRIDIQVSISKIVEYVEKIHRNSEDPLPRSIANILGSILPAYQKLMLMVGADVDCLCKVHLTEAQKKVVPCPACGPKAADPNGDRLIVNVDGNSSLRQFDRVAGHRVDNDPNNDHVEGPYWQADKERIARQQQATVGCPCYRALRAKSGSNKAKDLRIKGVVGAMCHREVPLQMTNIFTPGESFNDVTSILNQIVKKHGSHIAIMYNVACRLRPALSDTVELSGIADAPLAVGIFHIFDHEPSCQADHHPYACNGFGLSCGECLERLWSFLGGYASSTRYMSPENRLLVLTVGLNYYASRKIKKIGASLVKRWQSAAAVYQHACKQLQALSLNRQRNLLAE
ncbi:hypothetical protein BJV82DRAFT_337681 [Fennellomyces sp. T-0311]|nr:hypothetical protein BJV82DRAFT_337681 [Fennellomyces sp. T-0311]